jgi:hypothetical protein
MKKWLALALFVGLAPAAVAHVGSPNTFFQGDAGPYPIRAVVRPPGAVPGLAEISIKVEDAERVWVLPGLVGDQEAQRPPPDEAKRVLGEPNMYSAELWLMDSGAYGIEVRVEGKRGSGVAIIPVTVASIARQPLPMELAFAMALAGLFLFVSSIFIAGKAARDLQRSPQVAMVVSGVIVGGLFAGFGWWWSQVDRDFTSNVITKPVPINVKVRLDGSRRVLELTPERDKPGPSWTALVPDHGKLMHLFLISRTGFAHIHPVQQGPERFDIVVPPLPRGEYEVYGDLTYESGASETVVAKVELPDPPPAENAEQNSALASDPDDSWSIDQVKESVGARVFAFQDDLEMKWLGSGPIARNDENALSFMLQTKSGEPVGIVPYMGMLSHAAVRRDDAQVFVHLHPIGTYSMASSEVIDRAAQPAGTDTASTAGGDEHAHHHHHHHHHQKPRATAQTISFPYAFASAGRYRIWVQMKTEEGVRTGIFDFEVVDSK